jgi:DNA helicase-2/ATP-dependent DNA helicase PcrA
VSSEIILHKLNAPQKEAVQHTEGPLLIFAGAGSGKTRVITNRVAYLISEKNVEPYNILAVTFTKKAAGEMKERITEILNQLDLDLASTPTIGTFHSIGATILRKDVKHVGLDTKFTILDQDDTENIVKEFLIELNYDPKQFKPKTILSHIESAKNDMIDAQDYSLYNSGFIEDIVGEVYEKYQARLKEINAVDFSDLLFLVVKLFKENKAILEKYQNQFQYIMVDEYQDTNKVQYKMIKMLAEHEDGTCNVCVVGDDDQGIYKWRGADIKNIINFQHDFPSVKVIKLEQNYRSTGNVITAAVSVIKKNNERVDKSLWTEEKEGDQITVYQAEDEGDEANFVVDEIQDMRYKGKRLQDFAVLYRTNYQSRAIEEALLKQNLPYKLVGGFRFYDRKEIKDLVSYLRFISNPKDYVSLLRIINVPTRKMGSKSISTLAGLAKGVGVGMGELLILAYYLKHTDLPTDLIDSSTSITPEVLGKIENMQDKLASFERVIDIFGTIYYESQGLSAVDILKLLIKTIHYMEFINDNTEQGEQKVENVKELENVAVAYGDGANSLQELLEGIALIESEQNKNESDGDTNNRVTLMSIHASKGLEFPVVFIIGMEEGLLPHSRSFVENADMEEERRLCYVGITRAKEKLYLTFAETRMASGGMDPYGRVPSRFLSEIPQELCEFYSWNS